MWVLIARSPRPDAPQWPGRRGLAALDALVWPSLWAGAIAFAPLNLGILGRTGIALAVVVGLARTYRAVRRNERYWFTTSRWGALTAALLLGGILMKLVA